MNTIERLEAELRQQRERKYAAYLGGGGIRHAGDLLQQLDLLDFYGPNIWYDDVTDDTDLLPTEFQQTKGAQETQPLIFFSEPPFKASRVYSPRAKLAPFVRKEYNISGASNSGTPASSGAPFNLNANTLTITTNHADARHKKFIQLCMVFWSDTARTTKETTTARTITLWEVIKSRVKDTTFITKIIQYQATATVNVSDRTASDLVIRLDPFLLPRLHELQLQISSLGVNVYVDAWITTEVLG